ncbi:LuxR family maltose regulon positive regulatory protein [Clostridium tetanomorphum]|uniref:AAA family ATPase n=1 Tax=Clostridium tetanomorphum TaxID=1553 RepID=A0A923ECH0_CLOTT|nr:ATP-binding protein [Clostridium tetanomorphum]KAJ49645.1 LuxR family ATP-dependent transcriptional regulator [Clostridium tetanomorphum DSM 665]KAJ52421.1 LuxR family ATP-dependent transcriptional regulator [Clostridium tetanomorphum DSM 665]MBC2397940.1 AAA family ATPase [Clostridium tetanomorphum]MBP1864742.1 LuxR family maltose regulon positive regulatory protein [Clostridium tetanomorphum]NRS83919.1 LuxR family maltose regulon positive regulatory protein [Clostridium tetanomorphum]
MSSTITICNKEQKKSYENEVILRYDLFEILNQILSKKITYIHGPAGYGKTTLISTWIEINNYTSDTIYINTLNDEWDQNSFLYSIIISIEKYISASISSTDKCINNTNLLFTKLQKLMETLSNMNEHIFIIIDNFELLKDKNLFEKVLCEYYSIPDNIHFILLSKTLPIIGLSQLKLNDTFFEIGVSHLKFTMEDTEIFFNKIYELNLNTKEIENILSFTEGWPSILKLIALTIQETASIRHNLENLTMYNYYVYEYLDREVFHYFNDDLQEFMLKTSILDELDYRLCMFLTGKENAAEILELLYKANVLTKCKKTGSLKYPKILRSFLKNKLFKNNSSIVNDLYTHAANWFNKNNMIEESFEYYLKIDEYAECLKLVEKNSNSFLSNGEFIKLVHIIEKLPLNELLKNPVIVVYYCICLALTGKLDREESILFLKGINLNSEHFKDFSHEILFIRITSAIVRLDLDYGLSLTKNYCESESKIKLFKEITNANLGELYFFIGDFDKSETYYKKYNISFHENQNIYLYFIAQYRLGYIKHLTGNLYEAGKIYKDNINKISHNDKPLIYITDVFYAGLANVYYELNDLDKSFYYINKAIELTLNRDGYDDLIFEYITFAKILVEKNKIDEAFDIIIKINNLVDKYNSTFILSLCIFDIVIILDKIGQIDMAKKLMIKFFYSKKSIGYLAYEPQHFSKIFLLFKEDKLDSAITLLDKMKEPIFNSKRVESQIKFLLLFAIVKYNNGNKEGAMLELEKAIKLGHKNYYCRIFLDCINYINNILIDLNNHNISLGKTNNYIFELIKYTQSNTNSTSKKLRVDNSLSGREQQVLGLVAEGLSNIEISKNIYFRKHSKKAYK